MTVLAPYELLDLAPGEVKAFTVIGAELATTTINTKHSGPKAVQILRMFVDPRDKPTFPYYWDATASTLVPQLLPLLTGGAPLPRRISITAVGQGAQKRYTVSVEALEVA